MLVKVGIVLDHVLKLISIDLIDVAPHFNLLDIAPVLKVVLLIFVLLLNKLISILDELEFLIFLLETNKFRSLQQRSLCDHWL
jgi:hypothetical protein